MGFTQSELDKLQTDLEVVAQQCIEQYCINHSVNPVSVSVRISLDVEEEYLSLRPEHRHQIGGMNALHGITVPPSNIGGDFTIILQCDYINENKTSQHFIIGTTVHEIIHIQDYIDYALYIDDESYDSMTRNLPLMLWSEYHARKIGHETVLRDVFQDASYTNQLNEITNIELPYQFKDLKETLSSQAPLWDRASTVAHFLGRLSIWEEKFPEFFTTNEIDSWFDVIGLWLSDLYFLLKKCRNIAEANLHTDELQQLLDDIF